MNATVSIMKFNMPHSQEFCLIHNEFKVQTGGGPICGSCAKELVMNSQSKHEEELTKSVKKKRVGVAMLPSRHIDSGFKNYIVNNEGQKTALRQCFSFAKDLTEGINRNLIMVGRTGTGKTHLSVSVAKNVLHKNKSARYITSEDMANDIANAWKKADDSEANAIHRFTDMDLLILDEYGLHDRHENRLQLVHKVLYARYDAKKPTMLISNLTVQQLKEDLGDRLWSRFQHDGLTVVECNWADKRVGAGV